MPHCSQFLALLCPHTVFSHVLICADVLAFLSCKCFSACFPSLYSIRCCFSTSFCWRFSILCFSTSSLLVLFSSSFFNLYSVFLFLILILSSLSLSFCFFCSLLFVPQAYIPHLSTLLPLSYVLSALLQVELAHAIFSPVLTAG